MFSESKKQNTDQISGQNIISKDTKITGDLTSEGDFRIDGTLEGNLTTSGKVVVGKTGHIKGSLKGIDAYFEGYFSGDLQLSGTLTLKDSAHVEGDVVISKLAVEPGATFNVNCVMKGTVKELTNNNDSQQQQSKAEKTA